MLELLLKGALTTLHMTAVAASIGFVGGLSLGILNCQEQRTPFLGSLIRLFVAAIRGTPLFVQVLIFYFALPQTLGIDLSPFAAGVLALGINSSAYVSEIIRAGINGISIGQWEACSVLGYTRFQSLHYIILPQMLRHSLPALTNEMTSLIKETSILMVIGVSELTKVGRDIVARELDPMPVYLSVAGIYLIMTTALSLCTHYAEKRLKR